MHSDLAPRLARNSLYYAIKSVVALASLLLVTPYMLRVLGTELFGVWVLAAVVISYAQLSDFGIGESVVKYAAEYHARRDTLALNRLVNTVVVAYLLLALLLGGLLLMILPFVARHILLIPGPLLNEAVLVFRLSVGIFFVNMVMGVFASLVIATQQMGYTTSVNIASTCLGAAGTFYFLGQGFGLLGLVATNAIVALFVAILNMSLAFRLIPGLHLSLKRWADRETWSQVFGYSWKVQASNLAQLLVFQLDRVILSRYLGLEAVAIYEIGSSVAAYARTFITALFSPMLPATSALNRLTDTTLIVGLYRRACKFMVLISIPFGLLVIALAPSFMNLWMGPGFELSALTLQLLLPAYLLNVLTVPGVFVLNGIGRPHIAMRAALCAGVVNIFLCFFLVQYAGYFGLIAGVVSSLTLAAGYFLVMLHRQMPELGWGTYRRLFFKPLLIALPAAWGLHKAEALWPIDNLMALLLAGVYVLAVGILLLKSGYLDAFERQTLFDLLPLRRRVR